MNNGNNINNRVALFGNIVQYIYERVVALKKIPDEPQKTIFDLNQFN